MNSFIATIRRFLKSEDGPTSVEYSVIIGLIILATVGTIRTLGSASEKAFDKVADELNSAVDGGGGKGGGIC